MRPTARQGQVNPLTPKFVLGLGSMSPEPLKLIAVTVNNSNSSESPSELKMALDRERNLRLLLEDQVRQLEQQLYKHVSVVSVAKKNKKVIIVFYHIPYLLF